MIATKLPRAICLMALLLVIACWLPSYAGKALDVIYTVLPQPPSLPYLPTYNGVKTKYFYGKRAEKLSEKRVGYDLEYNVMEEPAQVLDWYTAALKENGWTVDAASRNARSLTAQRHKERYAINITVVPPAGRPYRGRLILGYTMFEPAGGDEEDSKTKPTNGSRPKAAPVYRQPTREYTPR